MTRHKALTLALEALENGMKFVWADPEREAGFVAIDAIKEALAQPEQYRQKNPLGGPAKVFDAMAAAVRSGDSFNSVLSMYGFALARPDEHNFCPRCGKRTTDLTAIHTCTPPQGAA